MRVLFTTFPWASHHWPMVPTEWACRAAGHEVLVASTPALAPVVGATGLPFAPVGGEIDLPAMSRGRRLASWHTQGRWPEGWPVDPGLLREDQVELLAGLGEMQTVMAAAMVDDLVALAREWRPDLVVHNTVSLAGPVAAAAVGVPSVSHHWGGPGPHQLELRGLRGAPLPGYAALYERFGVPVRTHPDLWIDLCPPSMRLPMTVPYVSARFVPFNGPGRVPPWVLERPQGRRICVTWGETTERLLGSEGLSVFRHAVSSAAELGAEVLVATTASQVKRLGPLPDQVRPVLSLPLHLVLSTCDLIVHHGGSGTAMTAVTCGVPQLAVPQRPEPELQGSALRSVGAGDYVRHADLVAETDPAAVLRDRMSRMLSDPSYAHAARELAEEVRGQPAPADIVTNLCELAGRPRTPTE